MTDKPLPIPDAAIEAAARALTHELYAPVDLPCDHDYEVAEAILRAAAPYLVGKLYDDLRLAEHALGKAVTCLERHIEADADTYGTHVLLRKVWDHIHDKVEALRTLEAPE